MTMLLTSLSKPKQSEESLSASHPSNLVSWPKTLPSPTWTAAVTLLAPFGDYFQLISRGILLKQKPGLFKAFHCLPLPHGVKGQVLTWIWEARYSLCPQKLPVSLTSSLVAEYSLFGGLSLNYLVHVLTLILSSLSSNSPSSEASPHRPLCDTPVSFLCSP